MNITAYDTQQNNKILVCHAQPYSNNYYHTYLFHLSERSISIHVASQDVFFVQCIVTMTSSMTKILKPINNTMCSIKNNVKVYTKSNDMILGLLGMTKPHDKTT